MKDPRLEAYVELLRRYGQTLDLASPRVLENPWPHLEAALAYAEPIPHGEAVLDVGSGGGLPGIPLAIARPDLEITLAEVRKRRAAFLELAVHHLGLTNVRVYNGDVRKWSGRVAYVTAQAVASFADVYRIVRHAARYPMVLISRKGADWEGEVAALGAEAFHVKPLGGGAYLVALRIERERV
ncbi:16S rRNA (guanine(527)-N(7))-methyltransferase RsmG [Marinithermus hydrothermalis]|uniref:Ribosomal RNA small subunit methyltransferase G n=1 Tax=Marinithermus hydrothermalis (strain DSM 14884 / JCM 11576 / T1) TaxID=869210 RepID=F2NRC0_MARHT|nr:RsmG family class I SAM-dependent methyltransferase [Marinithermus hydrothermalis]AEB12969.1 Ribosomal RNA small subunit methyltransferase G [Marinithermus hydrothermalis DSM 14884]